MLNRLTAALAGAGILGLAGAAEAISVDLELSLVIDSSGSIDNTEFNQQITGYANAFQQRNVIDSIVDTPGGIAVNTILFAGQATEVISFRQLQTEEAVADFVTQLQAVERITGGTAIDTGILLATETIATNEFESGNIIIDVSGDGRSPQNRVQAARDAAFSAGVSRVNGLAIGGENIFNFYRDNVIGRNPASGGPDAFVLRAASFDEFAVAIADKIQAEVGAPDDPGDPVAVPAPGAIGLIGLGIFALGCIMRRRPRV